MTAAVLTRGSRSCLAEVRRLRVDLAAARAERDRLAAIIAAHLAADPAETESKLWRAYATESYEAGRADMAAELAATWPHYPPLEPLDGPALAELQTRRWAVRGEPRTRETFGMPHALDRTGLDPA